MKACKLLMISAEMSALTCLGLLLYMSARDSQFDYTRAAFCAMFAIVAVMMQSIQQGIKWDKLSHFPCFKCQSLSPYN